MSQEKSSKEVDLLDLFASIGQGLKKLAISIYDIILWLLFFGIKQYKYLILFILLGAGLGSFKAFKGDDKYESGLLLRSNVVSSYELKAVLDEVNMYFKNKNDESILRAQDLFSLDSTNLSYISSIKSHYVIDVYGDGTIDYYDLKDNSDPRDTVLARSKDYLYLVAQVTNPSVLPKLQQGLLKIISDNNYIKTANKTRLSHYQQELNTNTSEITLLDSLQKVKYFEKTIPQLKYVDNQLVLGEKETQLFHIDKLHLIYRRKYLDEELKLYHDPVSVISDFSIAASKVTTPASIILLSIIKFSLFGYIIILIIYYLRKISDKYMARIK